MIHSPVVSLFPRGYHHFIAVPKYGQGSILFFIRFHGFYFLRQAEKL